MFGLPLTTVYDRDIPKEKFLVNMNPSQYLRKVFEEQIETITWSHKISGETLNILPGKHFSEIEVLTLKLCRSALDKRALNCIDRTIPYYTIFVQQQNDVQQLWLGDKQYLRNGSVRVYNYFRTRWLTANEFEFPVQEKTIDSAYKSCIDRVSRLCYSKGNYKFDLSAVAFMDYCQNMLMSYSYKPLLILALIQSGGCIAVSDAATYFREFYTKRLLDGKQVERGNCVFADAFATKSMLESNVISNPVKALMNSGLFEFDRNNRLFSMRSEIYDNLTLEQVDKIESICRHRLKDYYNSVQQ